MTLVVDASVAVKWFFPEAGSDEARALLDRSDTLVAPSLVLVEIANAVWKRHRRSEIVLDDATAIITVMQGLFSALTPVERLIDEAASLSFQLGHPVYDCFYLALARRENASLVTADVRLGAAARRIGVDVEPLIP